MPRNYQMIFILEPNVVLTGCKFEFVRCLKVYETKFISTDHEGTLAGPYLGRVP